MKADRVTSKGFYLLVTFCAAGLLSGASPRSKKNLDTHFSNGSSYESAVSADGQYVAFESVATDLVDGDDSGTQHIYLRDRLSGVTRRITGHLDGTPLKRDCYLDGMSSDGRYILFSTGADDVIAEPTPPGHDPEYRFDGYVYDRDTGKIELVTVTPAGKRNLSMAFTSEISTDGRFVTFQAWSNWDADSRNSWGQFYVRDRQLAKTFRITNGFDGGPTQGGDSLGGSISADGRYVVFSSAATNLTPNATRGFMNVFLHDRELGKTYLISKSQNETPANGHSVAPVISGNGRYIAYYTYSTNMIADDTNENVDVIIYDRSTQTTTGVLTSQGGVGGGWPYRHKDNAFSFDGSKFFFLSYFPFVSDDTNDWSDVYSYDLASRAVKRISVGPSGVQGNFGACRNAISTDGRFVSFANASTNFIPGDNAPDHYEVYVRDLQTGTTELISVPLAPGMFGL